MALEPTVTSPDQPFEGSKINEAVSYKLYDDKNVLIHLLPMSDDWSARRKHNEFLRGLCMLSVIMEHDPKNNEFSRIERINTVSWAIAKNPDIMAMFKFTVDRSGSDPMGRKLIEDYRSNPPVHMGKEYRDIAPVYAFMARKDFVDEYGPDSKKARKYGIQ